MAGPPTTGSARPLPHAQSRTSAVSVLAWQSPAGILGAALALSATMLDTGRGAICRLGEADFVAHSGLIGPTSPE